MKILSFTILMPLLYSTLSLADTVKLGADNWCPYNCDPKDQNLGYVVDIVKIALAKNGHKLDYSILPWARAVSEARASKLTGVIGASKGDAPDFIFGEESIAINQECFFVTTKDLWSYKDPSSLNDGKMIATVKDYSYSEKLAQYFKANEKQTAASFGDNPLDSNFKKLAAGRVARVVDNPDVVANYLAVNKLQDQFKNVGCEIGDPLFVAFDPKNPKSKEYAKLMDDTIKELKKTGEYAKILAKYGLK